MTASEARLDSPRTPAPSGFIWIGLAAVGLVAFSWLGLASLFDAWQRPEYSHGYLIPPIALCLFLDQLRRLPEPADTPSRGLGVATVLSGLAVGFLGNLVHIPDVVTYGLIVTIAGLMLVVVGARRGLKLWAPVFYLIFMLPVPSFIYWSLSANLQLVSSEIGVTLIELVGVPVLLEGNIIDLGHYKLQVAEACSGLRYLFPLMSFGFLFAVLYRGPFWHRVLLFVSTLPITVLMNSARIGIIGFLVDRFGIAQAEGFLHFFEGWVIFLACVALLFVEAIALQRLTGNAQGLNGVLDIDFGAWPAELRKIFYVPASPALVFSSIILLIAGASLHLAPATSVAAPQRDPLALFPLDLAEWRGTPRLLDREIERVLGADDYLIADFGGPDGESTVNLFVAYYQSQTSGSGIHSPEVCIPSGGWEVSRWTSVDSGVTALSGEPLSVNRAIIQKGEARQLVYYWFEQRGQAMTSDYAAKLSTIVDFVSRRRTDGALVRVLTPIGVDEPAAAADARLREFLTIALPKLPAHLPS